MSFDLDTVQAELKSRIEADAYFSDIVVLDYKQKDIASEVEKLLGGLSGKAGKNGLFVYLSGYYANVESPDVYGPFFSGIGFNVVLVEVPLFNMIEATGTRKPALEAAIRVAQVLHHARAAGVHDTILCERGAIRQVDPPDENSISYSVPVIVPAQIDPIPKCATPALTADGATPLTVTITCATSGASIYYTTNDSYPWSGNTAATRYTAPIALSAAATIRAVAVKTGMLASDSALGIYS